SCILICIECWCEADMISCSRSRSAFHKRRSVEMSQHSAAAMTNELAAFVASFTASDLPDTVADMAKTPGVDGTGALVAAANVEYSTGRIIADFVREQGGTPVASVVGHGFKTSPVMAALANGTMDYACDVEPHHPEGILHPVAVMIPTAMAIGEG